jgi:hypothetical protein
MPFDLAQGSRPAIRDAACEIVVMSQAEFQGMMKAVSTHHA